ncbi:MAG: metal ABC transporter permease, partial [Bacillota bacterium]
SLMIIPVATAMKVGRSFKNTLFLSIIFSEGSVILGLWFSYIFSIPSGATIVLFNIAILVAVIALKKFILKQSLKEKQQEAEEVEV